MRYFLLLTVFILSGCQPKPPQMMPKEKALAMAAQTPQAKAIISYRNGALAACLEKKVVKSCDSEWVTCRDDAWVVQYLLTPSCPVKGDGRLGMNFVLNGYNGSMISHYPEVEYFADEHFCRDDGDCVGITVGENKDCRNFVASPFYQDSASVVPCRCQAAECILKEL